jgi:hypothetical protein
MVFDERGLQLHLRVLRIVYDTLEPTGVNWVVTGSLGLALQDVPLVPNDIDIESDTEGAYEIERLLADNVSKPIAFSTGNQIRSHFGALQIDGLKVEVMGGIEHQREDGTWEPPADLNAHKRTVDVAGMRVPVLALEHEREAYAKMGRMERAEEIARAMEARARR